jgi:hypothetical protein
MCLSYPLDYELFWSQDYLSLMSLEQNPTHSSIENRQILREVWTPLAFAVCFSNNID